MRSMGFGLPRIFAHQTSRSREKVSAVRPARSSRRGADLAEAVGFGEVFDGDDFHDGGQGTEDEGKGERMNSEFRIQKDERRGT